MRPARVAKFCLSAGLGGVLLLLLPFVLELEEDAGLGLLFVLRGPRPAPTETAVVGISSVSAEALGISSDLDEWPRILHAELIDRLSAAGAAVIVMDMYFQEHGIAEHDRRLAESLRRAGNVILLERVRSENLRLPGDVGEPRFAVLDRRIKPIEPFAAGALATAPFTLPTVPIRTGQFWTFGRSAPDIPNIPVVALQAYALPVYDDFVAMLKAMAPVAASALPATAAELVDGTGRLAATVQSIRTIFQQQPSLARSLRDGFARLTLSPSERGSIEALIDAYSGRDSRYINYYGTSDTIETVPFHDVLQSERAALTDFGGKVVFIGYSERRQSEQQDTFISVYSERSGLNLSGVEIAATAFANLLHRQTVRPLSMPGQLLLVLVWGSLLAAGLGRLPTVPAIGAMLLACAAYLAAAWYGFAAHHLWLPTVVPVFLQAPAALMGVVFMNYRDINLQRQRVQAALGRYVPAHVVTRLAQDTVAAPLDKQLVFGTCLVTDAERFTRLSESLAPDRLGELVSDYYRMLRASVERNRGYVADISGDSMVAIWAGAEPDPELKREACSAALDLLDETEAFNRRQAPHALPTGIGLECGELLLGNIGAPEHYNFRAVGDIVNSASRIQGLNRQLGTRVLASAAALDAIDGVSARRLGRFLLVGKTIPIEVFELRGIDRAAAAPPAEALDRPFGTALELFVRRDWKRARRAFAGLLESYPDDGPSRFYLRQCDEYATRRLGESWDGTIEINVK